MEDSGLNILRDMKIVLPIINDLEDRDDGGVFLLTSTFVSLWWIPGIIVGALVPIFIAALIVVVIIIVNITAGIVMWQKEKKFETEYAKQIDKLDIGKDRAEELLEFWNNANTKRRKRMRRALEEI